MDSNDQEVQELKRQNQEYQFRINMLELAMEANKHMFAAIVWKYCKKGTMVLYKSEVEYAQINLALQAVRDLDKDGMLMLRVLNAKKYDPKEMRIDE